MLFNSLEFLVFFPVVTLLYFLLPHRVRYIWLLLASYYFYMCWNPQYAFLMLTSTSITYASGLLIDLADKKENLKLKKLYVALSFISNLAILFFFKYFDFALTNVNSILNAFGMHTLERRFDLLLPVGISFYTFQALSYTMDVYRHDVTVEKNFLKYALFVSFFPQLVAGPIERSSNLIHQISERHYFDSRRVVNGLLLMLWGFFQKMVIADRAALLVDTVYNDPYAANHTGIVVVIATVLFAIQVYCDFSSYSDIARGAAEVMGFSLMKNFDTPYFSQSVAEFWRRWHISLSTWFRDYLYIPLGGNRKGAIRKNINLMIVFVVSGLWHGASWNFVIWGALNGLYQIVGAITRPWRKKITEKMNLHSEHIIAVVWRMLITFALINLSWVFFRASTVTDAFVLLGNMFSLGRISFDALFAFGLDKWDTLVLGLALVVLFVISVAKYRKLAIREWILSRSLWFQYAVYLAGIFSIMIFGIYGSGYDAAQFIYFQF